MKEYAKHDITIDGKYDVTIYQVISSTVLCEKTLIELRVSYHCTCSSRLSKTAHGPEQVLDS